MSYPKELPRENPSTYIVQDRGNLHEMNRLEIQDRLLTTGMGGVLPDVAHPESLQKVLDVGCGTGGWLIETAMTYPSIKRLFGADISNKMLEYARTQALAQQVDDRVRFQTMDALRMLEFPQASFDLVNHRLGASWLRTWEWKKLFLEYHRVLQPGGIARITEMNALIENNSPALTKLGQMSLEASFHSGRLWTERSDGVTGELANLMRQHGFVNIRTRLHSIVLRHGTDAWQHFYQDIEIGYRIILPFLQKWTKTPSNYQEIYQQALQEMQQPGFVATWTLLTVYGNNDGKRLLMRGLQ